jgi:2-polyprenyl-3-methyl-5-hydroxy-6-metoxy-1,4-benzoquinol methylase
MEPELFRLLERIEGSWWYRGRAAAVHAALKKVGLKSKPKKALDVGCGFGGMCDELLRVSEQVYAWEPHLAAHEALRTRRYAGIFHDEQGALVESYDLVGMFDVLEHMKDDFGFLERLRGSLTPAGRIIITVPAFSFLWSVHDELNHHYRRYTKQSLTQLLLRSGYELEFISYWNALFFLPAAIVRLAGRTGESALDAPHRLNKLLLAIIRAEIVVMRRISLPFGTSLVAVAHKFKR